MRSRCLSGDFSLLRGGATGVDLRSGAIRQPATQWEPRVASASCLMVGPVSSCLIGGELGGVPMLQLGLAITFEVHA